MAIVTKREEKRLENLKRLYNTEEKSSKTATDILEIKEIELPEVKINRSDIYKDLIVSVLIILLSLSGYLATKLF